MPASRIRPFVLVFLLASFLSRGAMAGDDRLSIATFNLHNLSPLDDPARFDRLAAVIARDLRAPDLLAVQEVQDSDGAFDSSVTDADLTLHLLLAALVRAGHPEYAAINIAPVDDRDGGQPGGNIRCAFVYRTDRLEFPERLAGGDQARIVERGAGAALSPNPALIAPGDPAFTGSRKPLAAEFRLAGRPLFAIAVHFTARTGDAAPGTVPPSPSQEHRLAQASVVAALAGELLARQPAASVVVLGDFNAEIEEDPMRRLENAGLLDAARAVPPDSRFSYVYQGRRFLLDHILVGGSLRASLMTSAIVHLDRGPAQSLPAVSDHDPVLTEFRLSPGIAPGAGMGCRTAGTVRDRGAAPCTLIGAALLLTRRRLRRRP